MLKHSPDSHLLGNKSNFSEKFSHSSKTHGKRRELIKIFKMLSNDGAISYKSFKNNYHMDEINADSSIFIEILKVLVFSTMPVLTLQQLIEYIYPSEPKINARSSKAPGNPRPKTEVRNDIKKSKASVRRVSIPRLSFIHQSKIEQEPNEGKSFIPEKIDPNNFVSEKIENSKHFDHEKSDIIEDVFNSMDLKHQGKIRYHTLKKLIEDLNIPLNKQDIKLIFHLGDLDKDGKINLSDFSKIYENLENSNKKVNV